MRGLYAIVDTEQIEKRGFHVIPFALSIISAKPKVMQLRCKSLATKNVLQLLKEIVPVAQNEGILFFANDRPDLALLTSCDGVHVGQEDLSIFHVRKLIKFSKKRLLVGISTHNKLEIRKSIQESPDYVAVGPIFPTISKEKPSPTIGIESARELAQFARKQSSSIPLVGIGGIVYKDIRSCAEIFDMVAVIGELFPKKGKSLKGIAEHAKVIQRIILETKLRKE